MKVSKLLSVFFKGSGSVNIDGRSFQGRSVVIQGDQVYIDGQLQGGTLVGPITVRVEGDVERLETAAGDVEVAGSCGSVTTASGDVVCGDVRGSVSTMSGDVECRSVAGSVSSMSGDIRCRP